MISHTNPGELSHQDVSLAAVVEPQTGGQVGCFPYTSPGAASTCRVELGRVRSGSCCLYQLFSLTCLSGLDVSEAFGSHGVLCFLVGDAEAVL